MRLESMFPPDATDGRVAQAGVFGHGRAAPVGVAFRSLPQRLLDDQRTFLIVDAPLAPGPGCVLHYPRQPQLGVALPPATGLLAGDSHALADLLVLQSICGVENNL